MAGVATPEGDVPVRIYEDVIRKNVRLQGVWVSDVSHLLQAITLVEKSHFPFDRLVKRYSFDNINQAVKDLHDGKVMKPILEMG